MKIDRINNLPVGRAGALQVNPDQRPGFYLPKRRENWQLPDGAGFIYIFSQLPANGSAGANHFGAQPFFGGGPNDYFSDVEPEYWTATTGQAFNFYYGYTGAPDPADALYSAWAVTTVPEPSVAGLGMLGLALAEIKWRWARRA